MEKLLSIGAAALSKSGSDAVWGVASKYSTGCMHNFCSPCCDPMLLVHIPRLSMFLLPMMILLPTNVIQVPFSLFMLAFAEIDCQGLSTFLKLKTWTQVMFWFFFLQRKMANSCFLCYECIINPDFCLKFLH